MAIKKILFENHSKKRIYALTDISGMIKGFSVDESKKVCKTIESARKYAEKLK